VSKYIPEAGERVLIDGNTIGEIVNITPEGIVVYNTFPPGGSTNTVFNHISKVRFEPFPPTPVQEELPFEDEPDDAA
jgi:hypothetical protein